MPNHKYTHSGSQTQTHTPRHVHLAHGQTSLNKDTHLITDTHVSTKMCMHAYVVNCVLLFATPRTVPPRFLCRWNFPGKNTGVGYHFLLQGIFPNQGIKPESLASPALAGGFFTPALPGKPPTKT